MKPPADPLGALEGGRRPPWSVFRAALDAAGFRPSKTLGQNFLIDSNAVRSIVADAGLPAGARVLEVGAGCGFLTLHLAEAGLEVLAVEIDARLLAIARRLLGDRAGVRWLGADALAGKHALEPRLVAALPAEEPWHVVSNLPYSIAAPLCVLLARLPNPPRTSNVLVQEEVARRVLARPGDEHWGALTARLALVYAAESGRSIGPQLFWPRPRVASRVVHLTHRPLATLEPGELAAFDALVEVAFRQRRKQLLPALAAEIGRDAASRLIEGCGLDPHSRAEERSPAELLALARSPAWTLRRSPG